MALQDFGSLSLTNLPTGAQGKAGSPRAGSKTTPLDSATIDRIIAEEGADNIKPTALGIYGQESTGGTNAVRSIDGAEGGMQVTPDTFKRIAKPGERIDNPEDNFRVGVRYLKRMSDQFGVDPARLAVGYFSGEGNVNPSGDTPYKVDKKDGSGKTVSSYVRDLVARVGGAVASEAKAAEPAPDISKAPKYRDFIAKPQWAGLDDSQKTQARDAYFDRYVAPHLAPAERDSQREAFLQRATQIEGAGAPAAAKPGLLDRAVGAINSGLNAVLPSGGAAGGDPAGTGAAEILAVAGPEASKIGVAGASPVPASPGASLAPVTPAFRAEVGRAFDAATPEQRQQMVQAEGVVGQLARERAGQFAAAPTGETAGKFDTRAEARAARLTAAGADPKVAENFARYGAAAGQIPGTELGTAGPSNFDFETQGRFNKDPVFSNPVIRAAVKGYEGYRQGSLGLAQALFDATGNQEFADIARQGVTDAQRTTAAIGERGDGLQRNFEGAVSSIAQQLPALLAGMATGTEALPLAAMFTQTFGQEYGSGRAQGLDGGQAAARAGIYGAFEVIGEKFGLGQTMQALKLATRGAPTQDIATVLARGMLREIPGEQLTTLGQFLTDKVPGIGTNLEAGLAQYLQQAGDTLAQTVMQGGLMMGGTTGVSAGVRHLQGAPTQTSQELDAERAREQAVSKAATFFQPPARPKHASTAAAEQVVREMAAEAGMDTTDLLPAEASTPAAPAQPAQADVGAVPASAESVATDTAPPQATEAAMPTAPAATPQAAESPDIAAMSDAILAAEAARGEPNGSASAVPAEPVDPRGVAPDAGVGVDLAAGRAGPVQGGDDGRASAATAGVAGADVVSSADGATDGQSALSDRYAQAVDVVRKSRSPSVAVIQHNLHTDYSTAAGMLAQMEHDGIVTAPNERGVRSVIEQHAPAAVLDAAAHEAAMSPQNDLPQPTDAQKQAGNYKMGHTTLHGLDITIENPRGSTRSGTDAGGKAWSVEMANHYGYLKRTEGADGDHVDVFIGPKPESGKVFVVDQIDPRTGKFDEHKVLLGFSSLTAARAGYLANYEQGWKGAGAITSMSMDQFKSWLKEGDTTKPLNPKVGKPKTEKQASAARAQARKVETPATSAVERQKPKTERQLKAERAYAALLRESERARAEGDTEKVGLLAEDLAKGLEERNGARAEAMSEDLRRKAEGQRNYAKDKPKTEKQARIARAEAGPVARGGKPEDSPILKRTARPGRMAADNLRAKFAPIIKQWTNGPKGGVEIVQSVDDLPAHLAANLRAAGEDGRAQGFYLPKSDKVYLISDNLPSLERAQEVVFHEVYGHKGMRAILPGEQYAEMMGRIRRANPKIAAAARAWFDDYGDSTIEMNMAAGQSAAEARSNAELLSVEEALADMAATVPVAGPVRKLLAALQAGLRKIGLQAVADWLEGKGEAETFALLRGARAAVFGVTGKGKTHVLADRGAMALSRKDSAAADDYRFATEVMTELAAHDELFKWPPSGAHTLDGVLADIDPTIKVVGDATREDERDESGAERRTLVRTSNDQDAYVFERGRDVWLDVSRLDPGSGGDAIYQAVANYALNARKRFIGDPAGLSPAAIVRRTYHMLGSALRFGTTEHFQPAPEQIKGLPDQGIPPLEWRGSDADKLAALAKNFTDTLHHLNPELRNVRYDFDRAKFFDGNVEVARGDLPALAPRGSGAARAGSRTVAASVVLASLARATISQKSGLLARALRQSGQLVAGDLGPLFSRSAGARWQAPDPTRMDRLIYELQDRQIDLRRVQTAIREQVGSIPESFDAYQKEESYHGRVAARTAQFLQRELRPLIEDLRVRKISMEELEAFLWARHARERNAQIASINPDFPDGGSGLTDRQAASYFAGADVKDSAGEVIIKGMDKAKLADLKALAARVDAMNAGTQQVLIQYGLENPETINAWSGTYKHYVPLKREDMDGITPIGQGFSIKGSASKRAMGSGRRVADILANVALAREAAITRGEKNRVTLALYGLAVTNVNPGFWTTDKPPTVQKIHPTTGKVIKIPDPSYLSRDNVIVLRVRGEDRSIAFNEKDPRAMRIASSLKNLDVQPFGEIMGAVARTTRYLAAINTQYNPVFGLLNAVRDVQGAALNLTTTPISDKRSFVLLNAPAAMRAIWQVERHDNNASPWAKLYEQLQLAGGTTGYREIFRTGKDKAESLQKEIDSLDRGAPRKMLDYTLNWLDHYNTAIENAIRLTAFKAALDKGLSEERAGSVAKNLTVNFNRRGRMGRELGSLYAFFNAAVQGTARMMETLDPRTRHGKAIIVGGVLFGVIQALVAAAAMDEDDWDAIPEFTKQRNFIIPMGKSYAMIPMPLGFNVLPNIGRILTEAVRTGGEKWRKQLPDLLGVLLDNANPLGSGTFAQILAPTVADPIVALAENKDFTGKAIFKEDQNAMRPKPGFQRAKDTASTVSKGIAYGANWATGGTAYTPGLVSPTPDQLDYIFGTVTGGLGREVNKVYQTTELMVKGKDVPEYKKPIIGRFYGDFEGDADTAGRYWNVVRDVNEKRNEFSGRIKDGGDAASYLTKHPELQLAKAIDKSQQAISKLRKTKDQIEQAPGMKEADRTAAMDAVDKQTTAVMESIIDLEKSIKSK
ncbi:LPD38 domain-containing protein [Cupriavidus basilensis]|uniref:LPD38 domain-containing protein n=1 Tax=Cupriavidus basilensis TaxID=68895 RepID=UPI000750F435|nr:LPD38 domain-containing protein [Cupriavidus basilensis]